MVAKQTGTGIKTGRSVTTKSGQQYQRTPDGVRISDPSGNTLAEHSNQDFLAALAGLGVFSPEGSSDLSMSDDWQDQGEAV